MSFQISSLDVSEFQHLFNADEESLERAGVVRMRANAKPGFPCRVSLQDAEIGGVQTMGIRVPDKPGQCVFENGFLINRMNRTQASVWHLSGETPALPDDPAFTDITDSTGFLAVFGQDLFAILEKLSALDFLDSSRQTPFLLQGPFSHLPCQIVTLDKTPGRSAILMTCSRGYARDMVGAILEAGMEFKLRPAGEQAFSSWLNEVIS